MLNVRYKIEREKAHRKLKRKTIMRSNTKKSWWDRQDGSVSAKQKTIFPANQSSSSWIKLREHFGFMANDIFILNYHNVPCTQALGSAAASHNCLGVKVGLHLTQVTSLSHDQTTLKYNQNLRRNPHRCQQNMQTPKVPGRNHTCNLYGILNATVNKNDYALTRNYIILTVETSVPLQPADNNVVITLF